MNEWLNFRNNHKASALGGRTYSINHLVSQTLSLLPLREAGSSHMEECMLLLCSQDDTKEQSFHLKAHLLILPLELTISPDKLTSSIERFLCTCISREWYS